MRGDGLLAMSYRGQWVIGESSEDVEGGGAVDRAGSSSVGSATCDEDEGRW